MTLGDGWRVCSHRFGWSYNPSRRVRFCRICAYRERLVDGEWVHDEQAAEPDRE